MKIRNGFVSNSSSSSFILFKAYMTKEQIEQVRDWDTYALTEEYFEKVRNYYKDNMPDAKIPEFFNRKPIEVKEKDFEWDPCEWRVQETNQTFDIGTDMDNYDFEFFLKVIGIDVDKIGLRTLEGHDHVLGLNDARTDIKDFVTDPYYFSHYDEEYWHTSKEYKERVYKDWIEGNEEIIKVRPDMKDKLSWPPEPKEKKVWICEDAGMALNEVEHKIRELAQKNDVFYLEKMSNGQYFDEKTRIYAEMIDAINEVKDNWRARDDFDNPKSENEDDSQRVIAALEGQGYFSPEEEKKYNESVDKLYKPLGVSVFDLGTILNEQKAEALKEHIDKQIIDEIKSKDC